MSAFWLGLALIFGTSAATDEEDGLDWALIGSLVFQLVFFWSFVRHAVSWRLLSRGRARQILKTMWAWIWVVNWWIWNWVKGPLTGAYRSTIMSRRSRGAAGSSIVSVGKRAGAVAAARGFRRAMI